MYNSFFGFSENPFNLTPDPRYLFMSPFHKEAIEHMLYGINERKGFIVITGGIGTGKTTLCRNLLNQLGANTKSALIFNSFILDMELLKSINQEFGINMPLEAETKKDYIDALNRFLLDIFAKGGNAVLIIDEAQNLSHKVLEQIRMLSNLETAKEKLIQVVLVGQPEIQGVLAAPSLRQLNERVMVRYDLRPLAYKDIMGYIDHRMVVAGGHGEPRFTKGAVRDIYFYSKGNPRRINNICDRALLISYALGRHDVSRSTIKKSFMELYGHNKIITGWGRTWLQQALYALILLIIIVLAGFGGWKYRERLLPSVPGEEMPVSKTDNIQAQEIKRISGTANLRLDARESLSILFSMFQGQSDTVNHDFEESYLDLVSYDIPPEYYVIFKKPFRITATDTDSSSKYIVIKDPNENGATAVAADGEEHPVERDFIISNWGGQVSWLYPRSKRPSSLSRGVTTPEVLVLQRTLNDMGYMVKLTGTYDQSTVQEIMRFQKDFGLGIDGIAGPKTKALLYQMVR